MSKGKNFQIAVSIPNATTVARNKEKIALCTAKKRREMLNDNMIRKSIHFHLYLLSLYFNISPNKVVQLKNPKLLKFITITQEPLL